MCGRYTNTASRDELNDRFKIPIAGDAGTGRFNIAPSEEVLAIVAPKGEPEARLLRWGLLPPWAKELKDGYKMINARVESVATSPAYGRLVAQGARRALTLADGYFEWLKPERRGEVRQPFHIQLDDGAPFAFASLWTPAKIAGQWIASMTIITCDARSNAVVGPIHERMPVILAEEESWRTWLSPELGAEEALALCGPIGAERLRARAANPALNKPGQAPEGPELLQSPSTKGANVV
jgi:putative SOS response-associated peptidase YedK